MPPKSRPPGPLDPARVRREISIDLSCYQAFVWAGLRRVTAVRSSTRGRWKSCLAREVSSLTDSRT